MSTAPAAVAVLPAAAWRSWLASCCFPDDGHSADAVSVSERKGAGPADGRAGSRDSRLFSLRSCVVNAVLISRRASGVLIEIKHSLDQSCSHNKQKFAKRQLSLNFGKCFFCLWRNWKHKRKKTVQRKGRKSKTMSII